MNTNTRNENIPINTIAILYFNIALIHEIKLNVILNTSNNKLHNFILR